MRRYRDHFYSKTERSRRQIPLPPLAADPLVGWRQITKRAAREDLIIGTRAGRPHSPNNFLRQHVAPERVGSELIANWSQTKEASQMARPVNSETEESSRMGATGIEPMTSTVSR